MSFKEKVIYQIYPKSFLDTNQDGIGDLPGIKQKIPYLKRLGVDMIWLSPIYPSPQNDNGYDVANYTAINPMFGTMSDFENLIATAKEHGIEVMLDMVFNHVSTEHEWFQKALAGDKKYQAYFILRDEPTDWVSKFGGNAWAPFGETGKFYLHLFDKTQADLNWRNPEVREELFEVIRFWMEKGVKGFRFDVINLIGKDEVLKDCAENDGKPAYTDRPINHDFIHMMNQATFGKETDMITVGEMSFTTVENCILYTQPEREELNMTFNFHHLKVDYKDGKKWTQMPFDFTRLKELFHTWGTQMSQENGWNALFWNNHDQPRALNRFTDVDNYRVAGAKMLASSIHLNRGTPYIYMGEEIGMLDPDFDSMEKYADVESLNAYQELLLAGTSEKEAFKIVKAKSRDNSRTPMQWDDSENGGFTVGKPWIKCNDNYRTINAQSQVNDPNSLYNYYKRLIQCYHDHADIVRQAVFRPMYEEYQGLIAYEREVNGKGLLVIVNFTNEKLMFQKIEQKCVLCNYHETESEWLQPYEARIYSK